MLFELTMNSFLKSIKGIIPQDRIYTDELRTLAWGTDASEYTLTPKVVVRAATEEEVAQVLKLASANNLPVTFRAAGTSLSGQAVTGSILLVAGKNWEKWRYNEADATVTLQPGIVGARVNQHLAPFGDNAFSGVGCHSALVILFYDLILGCKIKENFQNSKSFLGFLCGFYWYL